MEAATNNLEFYKEDLAEAISHLEKAQTKVNEINTEIEKISVIIENYKKEEHEFMKRIMIDEYKNMSKKECIEALHNACENNDILTVKKMMKFIDIDSTIYIYASKAKPEMTRFLLDSGIKPNYINSMIDADNFEGVKMFLEYGYDPANWGSGYKYIDEDDQIKGFGRMYKIEGKSTHIPGNEYCMSKAAVIGSTSIVKLLFEYGVPMNYLTLKSAASSGNLETTKYIMSVGKFSKEQIDKVILFASKNIMHSHGTAYSDNCNKNTINFLKNIIYSESLQ
jgi:hypothetical protein